MRNCTWSALLLSTLLAGAVACSGTEPDDTLPDDCSDGTCDPNFDEFRDVEDCLDFYDPYTEELVSCVVAYNDRMAVSFGAESALSRYRAISSDLDDASFGLLDSLGVVDGLEANLEVGAGRMLQSSEEEFEDISLVNHPTVASTPGACYESYVQVADSVADFDDTLARLRSLSECVEDRRAELIEYLAAVLDEEGVFAAEPLLLELESLFLSRGADLCTELHPLQAKLQLELCWVAAASAAHEQLSDLAVRLDNGGY